MSEHNVSFIGAGNVAWHIAPALDNAGYPVREVYSRNLKNSEALIDRLYQAERKSDLDFSDSKSRIFIVAVSDNSIVEVARELILPEGALLAHTSGAMDLSALDYAAVDNTGVFYPLQTFSKNKKIDLRDVPFCIEGNTKDALNILREMARSISRNVQLINSEERKSLHIAAVFACNFVNHMLHKSQDILTLTKLDFSILHPLIIETVEKALEIGPDKAQTGPARRHDLQTLETHMEYLSSNEHLAELYRALSQDIIDQYPKD